MDFIHEKDRIVSYDKDGKAVAEVTFPFAGEGLVNVDHTFVDPSLRGQGAAQQLMLELAEELHRQEKKAVLTCSYAASWFEKHKEEYSDILA